MGTEVIMPKVDMVMDTGTFVEWLKKEGDHVEKGEPLFIVLTDKANIEVEAPAGGTLAGLRAQPNDVIPVTEVIAYILEPGEALPSAVGAPAQAAPTAFVPAVAPHPSPVTTDVEVSKAEAPARTAQPGRAGSGKVRATPAARRLAAELGVDLALVSGRGTHGRIHTADVQAFAEHWPLRAAEQPLGAAEQALGAAEQSLSTVVRPAAAAPALRPEVAALQIPLPVARQKQVVPLVGPRKVIAERMAYSAFTAPHITLSLRVDMSEATRLRARVQDPIEQKTGQRLSFTAIVARAVAAVLPLHPFLNASLQDDRIILWDDVHLGIATSLENYSPEGTYPQGGPMGGLIVPVIREAQTKSLEQIVSVLADLVERARAKRLSPAEMSGSTFTISNLGMFGIESFTAIINPPESAILAVGKIVDTPASAESGVELRPLMNLTLSADHRVVDGATAAHFLAGLKATLENPYLLI
jgi:pyruvate dehydrogenase E2 component (dihydrolipoamide acetyltransferase)